MDTVISSRTTGTSRRASPGSRWALLAANAIALVGLLVLLFNVQAGETTVRVGQVAGETLVAQRQVTYVNQAATALRRQQARSSVAPVYHFDPGPAQLRRQQAATFLARAEPALTSAQPAQQKVATIRSLLPHGILPTALRSFPALSPADYRLVEARSLALLETAEVWRFDSSELLANENALLNTVPTQVKLQQRMAIGDVLATFLTPTLIEDRAKTAVEQKAAAARVPDVLNTIYQGEVIVRRGDLVTAPIMEELSALGLQTRHTGWRDVLASLVFAVLAIAMLFWYLHTFHRSILANGRILLLIDASLLGTVAAARLITSGHILLPFFLPVAAMPIFACVLVAPDACIALAFSMAILAGWIVANSYELSIYYFLTSVAGILGVNQVRRLKQFIVAGVYVMAVALLTTLAFGLADQSYDLAALREHLAAAVFNGFLSVTLALGAVAVLSEFFGVTTMLQLLELGQHNQPLLRRLMTRAPGTYNHSLLVASLVERASEEIGANSLVARLSGLYHDIGKTVNPLCFVENQLGIGNIHDELQPEESARLIRGHVPQGIRLGRQFKLPRVIINGIAEHHGTMTIQYFLDRARRMNEGFIPDEAVFTYPGPKPQTKETALVMLADGCESAVRAARDHSPEGIRAIVQRIFDDRIRQGQLSECPLTIEDLDHIRTVFCSSLNGLYHPRIDYPEPTDVSQEGRPTLSVVTGRESGETA